MKGGRLIDYCLILMKKSPERRKFSRMEKISLLLRGGSEKKRQRRKHATVRL